MLKRAVIERLCAAHPDLKYKSVTRSIDIGRDGLDRVPLFECMIDQATGEYLSEGYAFYRRWLDPGGEIWLDPKSELTHHGSHPFRGRFEDQLT